MKFNDLMALINWRMSCGWYYRWDLGYNNLIDWTGHAGKAPEAKREDAR